MVGADENLFFPRESKHDARLVLYYSSYLPLHGTETVVRAARLVQDLAPDVHFRIIGNGIEYQHIRKISDEIRLQNTDFVTNVPLNELPQHITEAALCLGGHFGKSSKAKRVIAGKTFQCLAMGKATIVGENDANRELLSHGIDAWFCKMNDYESLAHSILELMDDSELRGRIGERAYQTFIEKGSYSALSTQLEAIVEELFSRNIGYM